MIQDRKKVLLGKFNLTIENYNPEKLNQHKTQLLNVHEKKKKSIRYVHKTKNENHNKRKSKKEEKK